ncbi:MAG: DUF3617 domain-containing protein [Betaproteobacteria bacterium]
MIRLLMAAALLVASLSASAQSNISPGMWEYQMETKMKGMPPGMKPMVVRRCLTPQDVAQNKHLTQGSEKNPCTMSNMKANGSQIAYEFVCKTDGGTMKGSTTGTTSATSLEFDTRVQMVPPMEGMSDMQQKIRAKRVGNC